MNEIVNNYINEDDLLIKKNDYICTAKAAYSPFVAQN